MHVLSRQARWAYVFMLPSLILFLVFVIMPVLVGFYLSFHSWDILTPPKYVGLENYQRLMKDTLFLRAVKNTAFYTLGVVPTTMVIALGMALALNKPIKARGFFRTVTYLPLVTSGAAIANTWSWIYNPEYGVLNAIFRLAGVPTQGWLRDPALALFCIMVIGVWRSVGWATVIFLAGLQSVPDHLYDAAKVDGAGRWRCFRHITLPMLAPTTFFVQVMSVIGSFQIFDLVYITTQGGPLNSTTVMVHQIYINGFLYLRMGYASAMAYVLFLIIFGLSLLSHRISSQHA